MEEFTIKYGNIKPIDSADGEGVRVSLFVSGCNFKCKGCHNEEAWDFNYGKPFTNETLDYIDECLSKDYISGFSVLGGEPLDPKNVNDVIKIITHVHNKFPNKTIWLWTGNTLENIIKKELIDYHVLREMIDVLVDGPFILEQRDLTLKFRGSRNQRVIDVKKTFDATREAMLNETCTRLNTIQTNKGFMPLRIVLYCD